MKRVIKKTGKIVGIIISVLLLAVLFYVLYVILSYHRIEDHQIVIPEASVVSEDAERGMVSTGEVYTAISYNVGFLAYVPEYSFFMDGGKYSRAFSQEDVLQTGHKAAEIIKNLTPDFALLQEVDTDGTRSYHVNELELFQEELSSYYPAFVQNYDSAYLFYPFTEPHGKNQSGICLFSKYPIALVERRSLPISTSFSKFLDLDRCYSINRIPVENGKELVIINLHLSAYGSSDKVRKGQLGMLFEDMTKEYEKGNYVLCGGDFNHDLKAGEGDAFAVSWAAPFPRSNIPNHFAFSMDSLEDEARQSLWDSARNTDMAYEPGVTYTVTLDGFLYSDNIELLGHENINTGYSCSDHDPVKIEFKLK